VNPTTEIFVLCAGVVAVAGALVTVVARSPLRAAMGLLLTVGSTAAIYLALHAALLAVLQLLVYAGAIVVLFVFVIMMIGPMGTIRAAGPALLARTLGVTVMAIVTAALAFTLYPHAAMPVEVPPEFGWVNSFGRALYVDTLLPFELVGVTLLVAIVGAVAVARGRSAAETEAIHRNRAEREAERERQQADEQRVAAEVAAHGGH
jgi:NADH-quinone oxidoreductase subunit J